MIGLWASLSGKVCEIILTKKICPCLLIIPGGMDIFNVVSDFRCESVFKFFSRSMVYTAVLLFSVGLLV
jgi:hypothetical protein